MTCSRVANKWRGGQARHVEAKCKVKQEGKHWDKNGLDLDLEELVHGKKEADWED